MKSTWRQGEISLPPEQCFPNSSLHTPERRAKQKNLFRVYHECGFACLTSGALEAAPFKGTRFRFRAVLTSWFLLSTVCRTRAAFDTCSLRT